jgi:hypothetical protein
VRTFLVCLAAFLSCDLAVCAQKPSPSVAEVQPAAQIPKGYEIGKESVSPDGRFAILYPLRVEENWPEHYPPNLLVRLKPYAVLAKVEEDGLPQNVTMELLAEWNGNSVVAIWEFRKWGIVDLNVYEIENDKVKRVQPVWREARKYFERDIRARFLKKYPEEQEVIIFVSGADKPHPARDFEFKGRKLLLNLAADNKPNLASGPHWTAEFHATWNLDTAKFEKVDFRPGPIEIRPEP